MNNLEKNIKPYNRNEKAATLARKGALTFDEIGAFSWTWRPCSRRGLSQVENRQERNTLEKLSGRRQAKSLLENFEEK